MRKCLFYGYLIQSFLFDLKKKKRNNGEAIKIAKSCLVHKFLNIFLQYMNLQTVKETGNKKIFEILPLTPSWVLVVDSSTDKFL